MSNGRKAKGGTSILKRLVGGNGDGTKTVTSERNTPTERGQYRPRETQQSPPPRRGRYQRSRMYPEEKAGQDRAMNPKRSNKEHRERVEEHKRKHPHDPGEGNMWML